MKSAFKECTEDDVLQKLRADFKSVKNIVQCLTKCGWKMNLPVVYRLAQDAETRFGTILFVLERFIKR